MGERTQLLFRIYDGKKTKENEWGELLYSVIYHYQTGCGTTMLMDALNMSTSRKMYNHLYDFAAYKNKKDLLKAQFDMFNVLERICADCPYLIDDPKAHYLECKAANKPAFHETEDDLFHSDNNDGWMEVNIVLQGYYDWKIFYKFYQVLPDTQFDINMSQSGDWSNYSADIMQCSLTQYVYFSPDAGYMTADPEFLKAYQMILKSFNIKIVTPDPLPKTDFDIRNKDLGMNFYAFNKMSSLIC